MQEIPSAQRILKRRDHDQPRSEEVLAPQHDELDTERRRDWPGLDPDDAPSGR